MSVPKQLCPRCGSDLGKLLYCTPLQNDEYFCLRCGIKVQGKCTKCGGRIIFTISQGSIVKYLEPAISLAEKYDLPPYLQHTLQLTQRRVEGVFGREKEKQEGLGKWFG